MSSSNVASRSLSFKFIRKASVPNLASSFNLIATRIRLHKSRSEVLPTCQLVASPQPQSACSAIGDRVPESRTASKARISKPLKGIKITKGEDSNQFPVELKQRIKVMMKPIEFSHLIGSNSDLVSSFVWKLEGPSNSTKLITRVPKVKTKPTSQTRIETEVSTRGLRRKLQERSRVSITPKKADRSDISIVPSKLDLNEEAKVSKFKEKEKGIRMTPLQQPFRKLQTKERMFNKYLLPHFKFSSFNQQQLNNNHSKILHLQL